MRVPHITISIALLLFASPVFAQERFSPPDGRFSVETPFGKISLTKEVQDASYPESTLRTYGNTGNGNRAIIVFVWVVANKERNKPIKEKVGGMEFLIGGDDDHDIVKTFRTVAGLPAKEVVYKNINARGLFIDDGDRVYILAFAGKKRNDLTSKTAEDFFSSFKLVSKPDLKRENSTKH